jgi:transcriptional regulator with XRE-family HTH domain
MTGHDLKKLRTGTIVDHHGQKRPLSRAKLAAALGVDQLTIARWEAKDDGPLPARNAYAVVAAIEALKNPLDKQ